MLRGAAAERDDDSGEVKRREAMKTRTRILLAAAAIAAGAGMEAGGAVKLGRFFQQGMVIQRDKPIPVWGEAGAGERVWVKLGKEEAECTAGADGKWRVEFGARGASKEEMRLEVWTAEEGTGKRKVRAVVPDVVVGEVWVCSGQSNMDLPASAGMPRYQDGMGAMILQATHKPYVRLYHAFWGGWTRFEPKYRWLAGRSALAIYWALELYDKLAIPVGVVVAAISGSNIDTWIPSNGEKAYNFNKLLKDYAPLAFRGVVWYQGETNLGENERYTKKLHNLYNEWSAWAGNPEMRFYFVQIAPYGGYPKEKRVHFPAFQEAQARFAEEQPNAAMTVISDLGDWGDIHPGNKLLVAKRHVLHALKRDYGFGDVEDESPKVRSATAVSNRVEVAFDHAKTMYVHAPDRSLDAGFELAGEDGEWRKARIVNFPKNDWLREGFLDGNVVALEADGVAKPVRVRYAYREPWGTYLYNQVNLPCATFCREVKSALRAGEESTSSR